MNLTKWAIKHGIPFAALDELRRSMGVTPEIMHNPRDVDSEAAAQQRVQLEASRLGGRLWRNNVGVLQDDRGVPVRYGLANESKRVNEVCKSSDLIGIKPVAISLNHVGSTLGVFVAREMKAPGWRYAGTGREVAQLKFLDVVAGLGGDAAFCTGEGSL